MFGVARLDLYGRSFQVLPSRDGANHVAAAHDRRQSRPGPIPAAPQHADPGGPYILWPVPT